MFCTFHRLGFIIPNVKSKVMRRVLQKVKLELTHRPVCLPSSRQWWHPLQVCTSFSTTGCLLQYITITICHLHQPLTATSHRPSRLTEQNALTQSLKDLPNTSLGPSRPLDFSFSSLSSSYSAFSPQSSPLLAPPRPRPTPCPSNAVTASLTQNTRTILKTTWLASN